MFDQIATGNDTLAPMKRSDEGSRGSFAAMALDTLERQTGLIAAINDISEVLNNRAPCRLRYGRILCGSCDLLVFRDRSCLALSKPGKDGELSILPAILTLELGHDAANTSRIFMKLKVDKFSEEGDRLQAIFVGDYPNREVTLPAFHTELPEEAHDAIAAVVNCAEAGWREYQHLPPLRRPDPARVQDGRMVELGDGLWSDNGAISFWPPALPRPVTFTGDAQRAADVLKDLGDLALWACPDMPSTLEVFLLAKMSADGAPAIGCDIARACRRRPATRYGGEHMLKALEQALVTYINAHDIEIPVGHDLAVAGTSRVRSTGAPIVEILLSRPTTEEAEALVEKHGITLDAIQGWRAPRTVLDQEARLQDLPSPISFPMADRAGEVFKMLAFTKALLPNSTVDDVRFAIGGGADAELMKERAHRIDTGHCKTSYVPKPCNEGTGYAYSILVGRGHDHHLRRPYGFATLTGDLEQRADCQYGGSIDGRPVSTLSLRLHISRLHMDPRVSGECMSDGVVSAITQILVNFFAHLKDHAKAQERHFEVDISLEGNDQSGATTEDMDFLTEAIVALRASIPEKEVVAPWISIGDVQMAWFDGQLA